MERGDIGKNKLSTKTTYFLTQIIPMKIHSEFYNV